MQFVWSVGSRYARLQSPAISSDGPPDRYQLPPWIRNLFRLSLLLLLLPLLLRRDGLFPPILIKTIIGAIFSGLPSRAQYIVWKGHTNLSFLYLSIFSVSFLCFYIFAFMTLRNWGRCCVSIQDQLRSCCSCTSCSLLHPMPAFLLSKVSIISLDWSSEWCVSDYLTENVAHKYCTLWNGN